MQVQAKAGAGRRRCQVDTGQVRHQVRQRQYRIHARARPRRGGVDGAYCRHAQKVVAAHESRVQHAPAHRYRVDEAGRARQQRVVFHAGHINAEGLAALRLAVSRSAGFAGRLGRRPDPGFSAGRSAGWTSGRSTRGLSRALMAALPCRAAVRRRPASPSRCRRNRCSGTGCLISPPGSPPRWDADCCSSNSASVVSMPGRTEAALQAVLVLEGLAGSGAACLRTPAPRWSMSWPSACTARVRQERTDRPSINTVQAPHTPCSQPTCVPVSRNSWRRKSASVRRTRTSAAVFLAVDADGDLAGLFVDGSSHGDTLVRRCGAARWCSGRRLQAGVHAGIPASAMGAPARAQAVLKARRAITTARLWR